MTVVAMPAFTLAGKNVDAKVLIAGMDADVTNFDRAVAWISDTGRKMDTVIHAAAMYALGQSRNHDDGGHRNTSPIMALMNAMPRSSRAKTLADWFEAFGNVKVSFDKKGQKWKALLAATDKCEHVDMVKAMATPFYSVEEKTGGAQAFDLGAAIDALIKKASSDKAIAHIDATGIAVLADIKALRSKLPAKVAA